jgi:protein phosphatase PTC7
MLVSGTYLRPKPSGSPLGEDALFTTPTAVGVADGVGGWRELKIDPGEYSRSLMQVHNGLSYMCDRYDITSDHVLMISYVCYHLIMQNSKTIVGDIISN